MLPRKAAAKTAAPKDFKNLADEMLAGFSGIEKEAAEKKDNALNLRLLDNEMVDMLSVASNARTAV